MFQCIFRRQLLRQLFVRTVAPGYCLLIKMFDQQKNSRHELIFISDVCWLFQNAVMFISGLILLGIIETNFFIWSQRDKCILFQPTDVQVGGCLLRSLYFFLDDKTSAPDVFNSFSFFPRTHFETSLVMVSYYRYEI